LAFEKFATMTRLHLLLLDDCQVEGDFILYIVKGIEVVDLVHLANFGVPYELESSKLGCVES
jgi:hypothetical protein